jgi:LPS O-antigen subunit length determinant protein (WzzB/FepE family)
MVAAGVPRATAQIPDSDLALVTDGDIAILQFLAAAEALENDLWQQYTELSQGNVAYQQSLQRIDQSLIAYINQDRRDELSHNVLINAVLESIGQLRGKSLTVDVSSFMVVPPPNVTGIAQTPRITNLQTLNVDTSWFNRYRSAQNPDLPRDRVRPRNSLLSLASLQSRSPTARVRPVFSSQPTARHSISQRLSRVVPASTTVCWMP